MRAHKFPARAGCQLFTLFLLASAGAAEPRARAQESAAARELAVALYPRASFLEEATRKVEAAKSPNWVAVGVYRTGDSVEDVIKYYKDLAGKQDVKPGADAVLKSLLRENWKINVIGFTDRSFYGLGRQLKIDPRLDSARSSIGFFFLGDAIVRVQLISPQGAAGTLLILVRERWESSAGAGDAGGGEEIVYSGEKLTRRVLIVSRPEPEMTEEARYRGVTGTVVLRAVFSADGKVKNIRVVSGLPYGLTEKVVRAAGRIKFEPAIKDSRFVSQSMQLEYNFNLR